MYVMIFVTTPEDLLHLCQTTLKNCSIIYVDTEFVRERTYFPILSLIQIATPQEVILIDALAVKDLLCLQRFFKEFQGEVVFFSARQDLETFYGRLGFLPKKVFDVQIALEALGHPPSTGYATAVHTYLGVALDKSDQYSKWLTRPLTENQLTYAANDVIYLRDLYPCILKKLQVPFKKEWLLEDMAFLTDPSTYALDKETCWKKVALKSHHKKYLLRLKYLAIFRETKARARDVPRSFILSDASLQEIALKGVIPSTLSEVYSKSLTALLKKIETMPLSAAPSLKPAPQAIVKDVQAFGQFVLKWLADLYKVHESYLATTAELESILRQQPARRVKTGWRYEVLTSPLLACLQGQIGLSFKGHTLSWLPSLS